MAETVSSDTRERITIAAADAVRKAPVLALSVQQVADAAGVTSSSIYKAYTSKYELFAEAARRVLVEQVVTIAESVDDSAPPLDRLHQVLEGLARVGREDPFPAAYLYGMYSVLHHDEVDPSVQDKIEHVNTEVRDRLRHRIEAAIEVGELDADVDEAVEFCSVASFGYLGTTVNGGEPPDPADFARLVVRGIHRR